MYTQHPETLDQLNAYHDEHLKAAMSAAESDRAVWLKYRNKLGLLLIAFGQRVRGDSMRDLMQTPPSTEEVSNVGHPAIPGTCV